MKNLNKYGYVVGCHTPNRTLEAFDKISAIDRACADASWHNGLCDCIYLPSHNLFLYIPNADHTDEDSEQWSTYNLVPCDDDRGLIAPFEGWRFNTIDEVINYIKTK